MRILFKLNPYNQQRQYEKIRWIYPIHLAMYATYLRNQGNEIIWDGRDDGSFDKIITSESQIDVSFLELPHADRILTDAFNPKWQRNGNFKYLPATYIMSASGCWWGKCSFCVENGQKYEVRPVDDVIDEIAECRKMGFREIFDDSGTFPIDDWLNVFLIKFNWRDIKISCNMRLINLPYDLMKRKGFRMLLIGFESANESTLKIINKGINTENIIPTFKKASTTGLEPHATAMIGFPFETYQETMNTINLVKYLLIKGYAKTAQMSFYTPPKDQPQGKEGYRKYITKFYDVGFDPRFWVRKIMDIHNIDDLKYLWKSIKTGINAKM